MTGMLLAVLTPAAAAAGPDAGRKNVLLLNSYHWGFAWTDTQVDGMMSVLRDSKPRPEVFVEYMDVLRQPLSAAEAGTLEHLQRRFPSSRFDLVLTTDDAALSFVLKHYERLFPGVPVVFSDAAEVDPDKLRQSLPLTGVREHLDARSTLELARRLRPDAKQIVVFANRDDLSSGARHAREAVSAQPSQVPLRIHEDLTLEEIVTTAAALSPGDIVFPLASAYDRSGVWHGHSDVVASIDAASPAPIFDITNHRVLRGLTLGGRVEDGAEEGRMVARMALRILDGENPRSIPIADGPLTYMFNYGQLRRHGVAEDDLPDGSIVVGKPPTLLEQYRSAVWMTAGALLTMAFAIVLLATNIQRRKRAEESLRGSNSLLDAISRSQALYIAGAETRLVFDGMLAALLDMTGSKYGFIGEVLHDVHGSPYLLTQAITNIAWDDDTRAFYAAHAPQGLEFRNLQTLFGVVISSAQPVISNDPKNDARARGTPPGHPPLDSFMGLPFFRGDEMVGMVGIANRSQGYTEDMVGHLQPFLNTCASITQAFRETRERQRVEEALRDSEARLRAAIESVPFDFFLIGTDGRYMLQNSQCRRIWGDVIGKRPEDVTEDPQLLAHWRENNRRALAGEIVEEEVRQTIGREERWIHNVIAPIIDLGRTRGLVGLNIDITDRTRAEEALKTLNATLETRVAEELARNRDKDHLLIQQSRLAAMGEMIGNIAHQWRQPINALSLLLTNLKDAQEFGELSEDYLLAQVARGQHLIQTMSATIDDFRSFFRPNREAQAFALSAAVRSALAIVESAFANHHIAIEVEVLKDATVMGFPNEFAQVLLNLLTNAKDAIDLSGQQAGRVAIVVDNDGANARVTVRDNGGGIAAAAMPKIFDPYFTTRESGTGIGLYMSKMIIESNMGGRIEAHNAGDGATFVIVMPVADAATLDAFRTQQGAQPAR